MSINDSNKFSENIKLGFKRTISLNKYRSKITTQPKNNNLDNQINPTLRNINRLFALSFKNSNKDPTRSSFDKYYMPLVEIKDFNAIIDNKTFLEQPQTRSVWKAYRNFKKGWLYNRKFITFFVSSKLLLTHLYRFKKTSIYEYSSTD